MTDNFTTKFVLFLGVVEIAPSLEKSSELPQDYSKPSLPCLFQTRKNLVIPSKIIASVEVFGALLLSTTGFAVGADS